MARQSHSAFADSQTHALIILYCRSILFSRNGCMNHLSFESLKTISKYIRLCALLLLICSLFHLYDEFSLRKCIAMETCRNPTIVIRIHYWLKKSKKKTSIMPCSPLQRRFKVPCFVSFFWHFERFSSIRHPTEKIPFILLETGSTLGSKKSALLAHHKNNLFQTQ